MKQHPVFLLTRDDLSELGRALTHMNHGHAKQLALRQAHPGLYSPDTHAESLVTNIQSIYTRIESILKRLQVAIDGYAPVGDSWHRDLLQQASLATDSRPAMIGKATHADLQELLRFRHAVRHNYATELRHADVFANLERLQRAAIGFVGDLETMMADLEVEAPSADVPPIPRA